MLSGQKLGGKPVIIKSDSTLYGRSEPRWYVFSGQNFQEGLKIQLRYSKDNWQHDSASFFLEKYSRRDRGLSIQILNSGRTLRFRAILGTDIYPWKLQVVNPDSSRSNWFPFTIQEPRPWVDGVQLTQLQSGNWIIAIASELISSRSKIKFDDKFGVTNQVIYSSNSPHAVPKSIFAEIPNSWVANAPDTVQVVLQNGGSDDPMSKPFRFNILNEKRLASSGENKSMFWGFILGVSLIICILAWWWYNTSKLKGLHADKPIKPEETSNISHTSEAIGTQTPITPQLQLSFEETKLRNKILDTIEQYKEDENLSVAFLASELCMHTRTLQRHVRHLFRCNPSDLISRYLNASSSNEPESHRNDIDTTFIVA